MLATLTAEYNRRRRGNPQRSTVLIVDDERINRLVMARVLESQFTVVEAGDGATAIERVRAGGIDLVVLDIYMPGMDGYETTRRIKEVTTDRFIPIILMTANNEEGLFARGLADGADDFVTKPVARSILEGKIKALLRMAEAMSVLKEQNQELNVWRARAEQDFAVAQKVFKHIAERGRFDIPGLDIRGQSLEAFDGDIVLAAPVGVSRLRILVGDFAGHGLGAALGALPVSDVFYAMTNRHFPIEVVVREIGGKLHRLFPRNVYLAACVADFDTRAGTVQVWNGGLPAPLIVAPDGTVAGRASSLHLPLGVLAARDMVPEMTELPFPVGSRFVAYTDGLTEACSPLGEAFDEDRLEREVTRTEEEPGWFASLWSAFQAFREGAAQLDDVTMVGLRHTPALRASLAPASWVGFGLGADSEISIRLRFDATGLREADPLAPLRILFESSPALVARAAELYTIASELFTNAVDHGLLRLDSAIKGQQGGFDEYYRLRAAGLRDLKTGSVTVAFEVLPHPDRPVATLRISDDGPGMSEEVLQTASGPTARSGRGLHLVSELGAKLRIIDGGRTVEATFPLTDA